MAGFSSLMNPSGTEHYANIYGNIAGMERTTVYFPRDLKDGVTREAARRGISEAELIREGVRQVISHAERPRPRGGLFSGGLIDAAHDEDYLVGFGE